MTEIQAGTAASRAKSSEKPERTRPRVLVVGGLTRLAQHYRASAESAEVAVVDRDSPVLDERLLSTDGIVVIPGHVSHQAARKTREFSRRHGLRLVLAAGPGVGEVGRAIGRVSGGG